MAIGDPFPQRITAWKCSDGKLFDEDEENKALRHQNDILKKDLAESRSREAKESRDDPPSGYGSSGGGGHD